MSERKNISAEDQREYWLGIGMLLFLVTHSRPEIANMSRELSKANDGANPVAFKKLLHVIKQVLDTTNFGLKFNQQ